MAKSKNRPNPPPDSGQRESSPPAGPALWLRLVLGVWLVWHVLVLFLAPMSFEPSSILVAGVAQSPQVRWYADSLYLNHGYGFFGPDPPVNTLVRYRVTDSGGQVIAEGELPNKTQQRPRLFYHRHMMLADQAGNGPPDVPREEWLRLSLRSYGKQLLRAHGGDRVYVDYVRHETLPPSQVLDGVDPNDPRLFTPIDAIEEVAANLDQPLPVPAPAEPPEFEPELLPAGASQ